MPKATIFVTKELGSTKNSVDTELLIQENEYLKDKINDLINQKEELKNNRDKQLENKDSQIVQMQNLLDQQQRLALQDKQLLQEYKSENDKLKSLKAPSLEKEKEFVETMRQTYEEDLVKLNQELEERKIFKEGLKRKEMS